MNIGFKRYVAWGLVVGLCIGLFGCQKRKGAEKCQADADCNNGTLCEAGACVPNEVAERARAFDALKAKEKKETSKKEEEEPEAPSAVPSAVPLIPEKNSDPPKYEDWQNAREVNTQHEHGRAKECSIKVVREWVRVFCRGEILGYQDLVEFGKKTVDHYVSVKENSLSFVGRIKRGPRQSVRICRKESRAALVVHWPDGKDRPEHIALGGGGPCDELEFIEEPPRKDEESNSGESSTGKAVPKPRGAGKQEGHLTPKGISRD